MTYLGRFSAVSAVQQSCEANCRLGGSDSDSVLWDSVGTRHEQRYDRLSAFPIDGPRRALKLHTADVTVYFVDEARYHSINEAGT